MSKPNVYMIEPKLKWYQTLLGYMAHDDKVRDPDVTMFVPGKFALRPFKKRIKDFMLKLDLNRIRYFDSSKILSMYQEALDKEEFKVVKSGIVQEGELESIARQAKDYFKIEKELAEDVDSLIKNLKI